MSLPQELIDKIAFYLPYEKAIGISEHLRIALGKKLDSEEYAKSGNLVAIQWMYYHKFDLCSSVMDNAAKNGHLELVIWLHENTKEECTERAIQFR